ncbi:MAG: cyclic pyranopterin monophosphate synthase MoaC [Myxococcales bacterium]|nr:cyclic pyranopterin monophosphate synthase MoaC [Myxococcales bacterium]
MGDRLTHLDDAGHARMVGVGDKPETARGAVAEAWVQLSDKAFALVMTGGGKKGDALQIARIAGISAAKRTSDLIPLCHPLRISKVELQAEPDEETRRVRLVARVEAVDRTGVEMEALTSASVAALTLVDMIKAVDRAAVIDGLRVLEKWGGRSGHFRA